MRCEQYWDNDDNDDDIYDVDLPSLTSIHCTGKCWNIHSHIGCITLESMDWIVDW